MFHLWQYMFPHHIKKRRWGKEKADSLIDLVNEIATKIQINLKLHTM